MSEINENMDRFRKLLPKVYEKDEDLAKDLLDVFVNLEREFLEIQINSTIQME